MIIAGDEVKKIAFQLSQVHLSSDKDAAIFDNKKSARRDSNPRPRPWQGRAPPTEPLAHFTCAFVSTGNTILYPKSFVNTFFQKVQG